MNNTIASKLMLVFLMFIGGLNCGHAVSLYDRDVSEVYQDSDKIVDAQVVGISAECKVLTACLHDYLVTLRIGQTIKGQGFQERMQVCSRVMLEIGVHYTLFLQHSSPGESVHKCKLVVPMDGAFERRADEVYRIGSPMSRVAVQHDNNIYQTDAILEKDFDENMKELDAK